MSGEPGRLPVPSTPAATDSAEYHAGLDEGMLLLPRCDICAAVIWYPRHHCPECGSQDVSWFEASGRGTVYSFTVVRKGMGAYSESAPYVLAYVELEEGPRVLTNLVGSAGTEAEIAIGDAVEAVFEHAADGASLLRFRRS